MKDKVYPVLRKATFSYPANGLSKVQARNLSSNICKNWKENCKGLIESLSEISNLTNIKLVDNQFGRVEEEGFTAFVVDHPLIIAEYKNHKISIRNSIAVCYQESSTKIWTRSSLIDGIEINNKDFKELNKIYDLIANQCCNVGEKVFVKSYENKFKDTPSRIGNFTVFTFGISNSNIGKYLDLFDDIDLKFKELITNDKAAKNLFKTSYNELFGLKKLQPEETDNNYWLTDSTSFKDEEGSIEESNVLYNIRIEKNKIFAFGLGHDTSSDGALANISSLRIARYYAKEI